jgi:hypothetical protein
MKFLFLSALVFCSSSLALTKDNYRRNINTPNTQPTTIVNVGGLSIGSGLPNNRYNVGSNRPYSPYRSNVGSTWRGNRAGNVGSGRTNGPTTIVNVGGLSIGTGVPNNRGNLGNNRPYSPFRGNVGTGRARTPNRGNVGFGRSGFPNRRRGRSDSPNRRPNNFCRFYREPAACYRAGCVFRNNYCTVNTYRRY